MKKQRLVKDYRRCKHSEAKFVLRMAEGVDQIDELYCPECNHSVMMWWRTAAGRVHLSYNHNVIPV